MSAADIVLARECLERCQRVLFITGAGVSADSGLPTYRGTGGLYNDVTENGLSIEQVLSGEMFQRQPETCWRYLAEIGRACLAAQPNDGHRAIAQWQQSHPGSWLLTQNIDGFHRLAGSPPERLIEIHGGMSSLFCPRCNYQTTDVSAAMHGAIPPICPACQAVLRTPVVLFGELLPEQAINDLRSEMEAGFDGVVVVGTTASFPYVTEPIWATKRRGGLTIEVNLNPSELSSVMDFGLYGKALDILTALLGHI